MRLSYRLALVFLAAAAALRAQNTIHVPADQPTIQAGINAANNGDTVLVAPGTYYENIDFKGKAITVTSGATSYAGAAATIIDGSAKGPVVQFVTNEGLRSVINGFTIRNGMAIIPPTLPVYDSAESAGGVLANATSPTIMNNVITANRGCGIGAYTGAPTIQGNSIDGTIYKSSGSPCGGVSNGSGISLEGTSGNIYGNVIYNNNSINCGGAIYALDISGTVIENNLIYNNVSQCGGTLFLLLAGPVSIIQNLVDNNAVGNDSYAGIYIETSGYMPSFSVISNTIYGNAGVGTSLSTAGEQLYVENAGASGGAQSPTIANNLLIGDSVAASFSCSNYFAGGDINNNDIFDDNTTPYPTNCAAMTTNLAVNPKFVLPATLNFHLQASSPVATAGNISVKGLPSTDFDGNPRVVNGMTAMGVYEPELPGASAVLTVTPTTANYGQTVALTATLSGAGAIPTGMLAFYDGATALNTATLNGGIASYSTSTLSVGTHPLTCKYQGDSNYGASTCNTVSVVINGVPTTSSLSVAPSTVMVGGNVYLTATVVAGSGSPTGTVAFYNGTNPIGTATLASGVASLVINTLPIGTDQLTCTYSGDSTYSTSACNTVPAVVTVPATTVTLASNNNPAYQGQSVTLTATVTATSGPTPGGNVTFFDGSVALNTAMLNAQGVASFSTTTLAVGTHLLTATYAGTPSFSGSSSNTVQEIIFASTFAIALSPTTITIPPGQPATDAIAVSSVGIFAGPVALTYGPLPQYATASISPATVTLTAGGAGASTLTITTLSFAANEMPARDGGPRQPLVFAAVLLVLVPFAASRRRLRRVLVVFVALLALQTLTGCTWRYTKANLLAAGSYPIVVTGTDASGNTQSATLTLVVTP